MYSANAAAVRQTKLETGRMGKILAAIEIPTESEVLK